MPGSPTFSAEAARVLVDAYLAQPEGHRDLRRVLAEAKQGTLQSGRFELIDPKDIKIGPGFNPQQPKPIPVDPSVMAELAGMSKSQAYELLRQDPRYQPNVVEEARELSLRNLETARRIVEREEGSDHPNWPDLRNAQKLVNQAIWGYQASQPRIFVGKPDDVPPPEPNLTGLIG